MTVYEAYRVYSSVKTHVVNLLKESSAEKALDHPDMIKTSSALMRSLQATYNKAKENLIECLKAEELVSNPDDQIALWYATEHRPLTCKTPDAFTTDMIDNMKNGSPGPFVKGMEDQKAMPIPELSRVKKCKETTND